MWGVLITIALAAFVFWLVAHVSVVLGVIAALIVLAAGLSGKINTTA